jgi:hypothetical protein
MQVVFGSDPALRAKLRESLSEPRFKRYIDAATNDELLAIQLYQWNSKLSQSLYIYLQIWEVCLRNRINNFLCWKHNDKWPYDKRRALRALIGRDSMKRLTDKNGPAAGRRSTYL